MRSASLLPLLLLVGSLGTACTTTGGAGAGRGAAALIDYRAGRASPQQAARAGWEAWLVEGKADEAARAFEAGGDDPWALAGRAELARRALKLPERVELAGKLLQASRSDPVLARYAARMLLDVGGLSRPLDDRLLAIVTPALEGGLPGAAALLLRQLVARIAEARDAEGWQAKWQAAGAFSTVTVAGPFFSERALDAMRPTPPEVTHRFEERWGAQVGEVKPRVINFPRGQIRLSGEPDRGDIFLFAGDVELRGGRYLLLVSDSSSFVASIDGAVLTSRTPAEDQDVFRSVEVELPAGKHRLTVRHSRLESAEAWVALGRADGVEEPLTFLPARGEGPVLPLEPKHDALAFGLADFAARLAPEVGPTLATWLAVRDGIEREPEAAKGLLLGAPNTPAFDQLRALVTLSDRSLPDRIAKARASALLDQVVARDPADGIAQLLRLFRAREDDRLDDAFALLEPLKALAPQSHAVPLAEARLRQQRGFDALADRSAREALALFPGHCEAAALHLELARRAESTELVDRALEGMSGCAEALDRRAEVLRSRGATRAAIEANRLRLARTPWSPPVAIDLARLLAADGRTDEARTVLEASLEAWPRHPALAKTIAEVLGRAGDTQGARTWKRKALAIDGDDLVLRRQLALDEGHDLLDDLAIDGEEVIAAWEKSPPIEGVKNASAAWVLDYGAGERFADGTEVQRIHTITQVLDPRGVAQAAEQHIPDGAIVLQLHTRKRDGRKLEPETIAEKDGISLPSVEVGDYTVVEYLAVAADRPASMAGFASMGFTFRSAEAPMFRSEFVYRAPASDTLEIETRGMPAPKPVREGDRQVVRWRADRVPLHVPDPRGPPSIEDAPMIMVGTGAGLMEGLRPVADLAVRRARGSTELRAFAREAAGKREGREAVRAVFNAVMEHVKGDENDFSDRATSTLARERGSRLWLLKGALDALGFDVRLGLVRPLNSPEGAWRFPRDSVFTYPVLRVALDEREVLWLDPSVRNGPFGELPDALWNRDVAVLPVGSEEASRIERTPPPAGPAARTTMLKLELSPQGDLRAEGEERFPSFDGARIRAAFERMDAAQQRQAIEGAMARTFRGVVLDGLEVLPKTEGNPETAFRYRFHAGRWARPVPNGLVVATPLFPAQLTGRFIQRTQRTTPMLIDDDGANVATYRIVLPAGFKLAAPVAPVKLDAPFGRYERTVEVAGEEVLVRDTIELVPGRVPVERWPDFIAFAQAVDEAQSRPLAFSGP